MRRTQIFGGVGLFAAVFALLAVESIAVGQLRIFRGRQTVQQSQPQQIVNGPCVGGVCPQVITSTPVVLQTQTQESEETIEENAAVVADNPHVRCIINGSCGSGTICGTDGRGSYVVTNAHVVGTTLGRVVAIDLVSNGAARKVNGRTVMAGYSSSRMVDFAIVFVEGLSSKRYMPMLKTEPEARPFQTTGSPRCVWPLVLKNFDDPRNYGDGLITGSPNAIGGQSGSAIYNADGRQIALLTWSIGGRCAGQKTSKLWQVASQRNVQLADPRPEGLVEVGDCETRPETEDGIFGESVVFNADATNDGEMGAAEESGIRIRPLTENVLANVVGSPMEDLPIWYTPGGVDPVDPVDPIDPDSDCVKLSPNEKALIEFIRAQEAADGGGIFGRREKALDWVKLIALIMEFIKLIQEGRAQ